MFKKETRKQTTKPKPLWPLVFRRFSPPRLGRFNFLAPTPVFLKASQGRWEARGGGRPGAGERADQFITVDLCSRLCC